MSFTDQSNSVAAPSLSKRQFAVVTLTTAGLIAVLATIYFLERGNEWELRVEQSQHRLDLAEEIFDRNLDRVRADLLFVAELPEVIAIDSARPETFASAAAVFRDFLIRQQTYSQVRIIGVDGMELIRVEWDGHDAKLIPRTALQDKSNRYYVSEALDLSPEEIYTSEFDLNLEQGEIERPLNPVLRFVTPLVPHHQPKEPQFLLVFNYRGDELLGQLSEISLPGRTYLVRGDGQFLLGPTSETQWGWLLGHSSHLFSEFEGVDRNVLQTRQVQLLDSGCFAVRPIPMSPGELDEDPVPERELYCVSHIPSSATFAGTSKLLYRQIFVGGCMLIPLVVITRFWAAAIDRRALQNQRIAASERKLRELSARLVNLQEEERRAVSREIHDSLGQQATAINLNLRMLKESLPEHAGQEVDRLIEESGQLLKELHGFATRVRPAELDDLGLKQALESHIWDYEARTSIQCKFEFCIGEASIDDRVSENVFRLVQEALNNIAKHAKAHHAVIRLDIKRDRDDGRQLLRLTVDDDGVGFTGSHRDSDICTDDPVPAGQPDHRPARRLGILGMQERVDLLGGRLLLQPGPELGTRLFIQIPISFGGAG